MSRLRGGDRSALGEVFSLYRERLWRMLYVRVDKRLAGRVDADDILQEAFLDIDKRIDEYLRDEPVPIYLWMRFLTAQRMLMVQRGHLGAQKRDVRMEVAIPDGSVCLASAESMAGALVSPMTSPSQAAIKGEMQARLRVALEAMEPLDREVLALRHFEELSNQEAATVLGISKEAASKRHVRALKRLKEIMGQETR